MHITLRRGQIASDQVAATTFAIEMAELVEQSTGDAISVWAGVYGMPLGTISWTGQVEDFAHAATRTQKLMENPEYLSRVAEAGEKGLFIPGSFEDGIARVVHMAGEPGPMMYASTTMGSPMPGKAMHALEWATEMTDHVAGATGNQVTLCSTNYGNAMGTMIFFMGFAGADSIDAAQDALMTDTTYHEMMVTGADLFMPDSQRSLAQRLH